MTQSEQNKAIIQEFFSILGTPEIEKLKSFMADDMAWIIPQEPKYSKMAGTYSKYEWEHKLYRNFLNKVKTGAKYQIIGITAENERVAVEVESFADTPLGKFHNRYHFLFILENGKIKQAKEYADSLFMYKFKQFGVDFLMRFIKNRLKK